MRTLNPRKGRGILLGAALLLGLVVLPGRAEGSAPATSPLGKVAPALAAVVAGGVDDALYRGVVAGHVPGTAYYFAKLARPIDGDALAALERAGATVRATFDLTRTVALSSATQAVAAVARLDVVQHLALDQVVHVAATTVQAAPAAAAWADQTKRGTHDIGADVLWAQGVTGGSVTVGVADSGVDSTHPDIGPKLTAFSDCSGVAPNLAGDLLAGVVGGVPALPGSVGQCVPGVGYDDNGHGTHVSGIATGSGTLDSRLPGVAPAAKLQVAKVCSAAGTCLNSAVLAGIQHLAVSGVQVINMSLGGDRSYLAGLGSTSQVTNFDNPETELVDALADRYNIVFSIAAGNSGPGLQSVGSPAVAGQGMAVAASIADWDLDHAAAETLHGVYGPIRPEASAAGASGLAQFSSRGPSGDRLIKPEVSAPGSYIVAAEALTGGEVKAGDLVTGHSWSNDPLYAVLSGTSMAAPSNAGAAALVIDGYHRATGADPAYYVVKSALTGTAHAGSFEGSVTGLLSSIRATRLGEDPHAAFPIRNQDWVGTTGEGAGRIDVPDAYLASTAGIVAYTPAQRVDGALTSHSLQPSWAIDDLAPGEGTQQTFLVRGGPALGGSPRVSWSFAADPAVVGIGSIQPSWVTLPNPTRVRAGSESPAAMALHVPAGTAPGMYAGTIIGTVRLGGATQHLRIPVQLFVPMPVGSALSGPIFTTGPTDYSAVGAESPVGGIATDWVMVPVRLAEGTTKVTLRVDDPAGLAHMDVFAFDGRGQEIDSSVSSDLTQAIPNDLALAPTGPDAPTEVVLLDGNDVTQITAPTTIWVVVSDTVPGTSPGFETYHLSVEATTGAPPDTTAPAGPLPGLPPVPLAAATARTAASSTDARSELAARPAAAGRATSDGPEPVVLLALLLDGAVLVALSRRLRRRAASLG